MDRLEQRKWLEQSRTLHIPVPQGKPFRSPRSPHGVPGYPERASFIEHFLQNSHSAPVTWVPHHLFINADLTAFTWSCPFSNSDLRTNWSIQYFRRIHCHLPTSELFYLLRTHVKSLPGAPIFYSAHSWFTIACTPDSYSTFILKFPSDQIIHVVNSHCACDATSWRNTAVELSVTIY